MTMMDCWKSLKLPPYSRFDDLKLVWIICFVFWRDSAMLWIPSLWRKEKTFNLFFATINQTHYLSMFCFLDRSFMSPFTILWKLWSQSKWREICSTKSLLLPTLFKKFQMKKAKYWYERRENNMKVRCHTFTSRQRKKISNIN